MEVEFLRPQLSGPQAHMHIKVTKGVLRKLTHQVPFQTIKMEYLRIGPMLILFEISKMILMKNEDRTTGLDQDVGVNPKSYYSVKYVIGICSCYV